MRTMVWLGMAVVLLVSGSPASAGLPGMGQLGELPAENVKMRVFAPIGGEQLSTLKYYGLRHTDRWFDMVVRNDAGTYFLTTNAVGRPSADAPMQVLPPLHPGLPVGFQSSPAGMVPNLCNRPWQGDVQEELTPAGDLRHTIHNVVGDEVITFGPRDFSWTQDGYIDLHGTLATPGINWYLPEKDPGPDYDPIYYLAQYYKVDGTYCGQDVSGYVYVENMWGNEDYSDTYWVKNRVGHWIFWTNEYGDGTREYGQFMCGEYGARGAAIASSIGKQVLATSQINATQTSDALGNTTHIDYAFGDGQRWEYVGDPAHDIPIGVTGTSLGGGLVRRVGETREIVRHDAVQLVAHRMCQPQELSDDSPPARRLTLIVRPRHLRAGRRTRLRVLVRRGGAPVRGVVIKVAGHELQTNRRGRTSLVIRPRHAGRLRVRALQDGMRSVRTLVRIRSNRRSPK